MAKDQLYGKDEGERRAWTADELLEEMRSEQVEAEEHGLAGTAGMFAALVEYIETHEAGK